MERFAEKFVRAESGCWLWKAGMNHAGYGWFNTFGKSRLANRVSWELYCGPIPVGLKVLHHCDVPACVNPEHLFIGTDADNVRDKMQKGRWRIKPPITHCKHGHEFTAANTYLKPQNGRRACRICKMLRKRVAHRSIQSGDLHEI